MKWPFTSDVRKDNNAKLILFKTPLSKVLFLDKLKDQPARRLD